MTTAENSPVTRDVVCGDAPGASPSRSGSGRSVRLLGLLAQFMLAIVAVAMLLVGGVAWRLSAGPVDAGVMIATIEDAMSDDVVNLSINVMRLEWRGFDQPLILVAEDVAVTGPDETEMARFPAMEVTLSARAVMSGRIAPSSLTFVQPTVYAERLEAGRLEFVLGAAEFADLMPPGDIVGALLRSLLKPPGTDDTPMSELQRLTIRDGTVLLTDHRSDTRWRLTETTIDLARDDDGISGVGDASVSGPAGQEDGRFLANFAYDPDSGQTAVDLAFSGIVPAALARLESVLAPIAAVRSPLSGRATTVLGPEGAPGSLAFRLDGDVAVLDLPMLFDQPLTVAGLTAQGHLDIGAGRLSLPTIRVDLGGPVLTAALAAVDREDGLSVSLNLRATDIPVDFLPRYWPPDLGESARSWVTANITRGMIDEATASLDLFAPVNGSGGGSAGGSGVLGASPDALLLQDIEAEIRFSDATLTYVDDLPPIAGLDGVARYGGDRLVVEAGGGRSAGLDASAATIVISGFGDLFQVIDIDLAAGGSLGDTLSFLDLPRLGLMGDLGIEPMAASGEVSARVHFTFPLRAILRMDHVRLAATADVTNAAMAVPEFDADIAGFNGRLEVDGRRLALVGEGLVSGRPVTLTWRRWFDDAEPQQLNARLSVDSVMLGRLMAGAGAGAGPVSSLGLSLPDGGVLPLDLRLTLPESGQVTAAVSADITDLRIGADAVGFEKPPGVPGRVAGIARSGPGGIASIDALSIDTMGLGFEGSLRFANGALRAATVDRLAWGGTRLEGSVDRAASGDIVARLSGASLDLGAITGDAAVSGDETDSNRLVWFLLDTLAPGEGVDVAFDLDSVVLEEGVINSASGRLVRTSSERLLDIEAETVDGLAFALRIERDGSTARFSGGTDDLGGVLSSLGIHNGLRGGSVRIVPITSAEGGSEAVLEIRDLTVIDAPVLARLLAAMSIRGLTDLLGGDDGLPFDRVETRVRLQGGRLHVHDAVAAGGALGLTAGGWIDLVGGVMALSGEVIPVYGVNRAIQSIPLVGALATGGTNAVFAFTYSVSGDTDDPSVIVNPLSVLAPGLLRRLFSG